MPSEIDQDKQIVPETSLQKKNAHALLREGCSNLHKEVGGLQGVEIVRWCCEDVSTVHIVKSKHLH